MPQEYAATLGYKPNLNFVKGNIEFLRDVRRTANNVAVCTHAD